MPSSALNSPPRPPFAPDRPPTRAERRRAEKRALERWRAFEEARRNGGLWGEHSFASVPEPPPEMMRKLRHRRTKRCLPASVHVIIGFSVALLGVAIGVGGIPVEGHGLRFQWVSLAAAVLVVGISWAVYGSKRGSRQTQLLTSIFALVVRVALGLGVHDSVVVRGHVYLSTSPTAKAFHTSSELSKDLQTLVSADSLVTGSTAWAEAHYQQYSSEESTVKAIGAKWGNVSAQELPSLLFVPVANEAASAADFEAKALTQRAADLANPDSAVEATIANLQQSYMADIQQAAETLHRIAQSYGFSTAGIPS
jgi:hypothetical protein